MKDKKIYLVLAVCMFLFTGCGLNSSGSLISEARDFIEKGEYDKAMSNLSKVIDEDESNTEARGMYYQAFKLKSAEYYDTRKYYEQEIKELQDLLNDKSGSSQIRDLAEEKLEKAQDAFTKQKKAMITRKENAKKSADEYKNTYRTTTIYGYNYNKYNSKNDDEDSSSSKNTTTNKNTKYGSGSSSGTSSNYGTSGGANSQSGTSQSGSAGNSGVSTGTQSGTSQGTNTGTGTQGNQ